MDLGIPLLTLALVGVFVLGMIVFSLVFLIDWIRNWRHVKAYWLYGVGAGLISLAFDLLAIVAAGPVISSLLSPSAWESSGVPVDTSILAFILAFAGLIVLVIIALGASRLAGFTMLGMHYAASMGHLSFPLLRRLHNPAPPEDAGAGALPSAGRIRGRSYVLSTLGVAAAAVAYSVVLFRLVPLQVSQILTGLPGTAVEEADTLTLQVLVVALAAAFGEEIVFRLGIQGFLARYLNCSGKRYWIPIVLTALLWTLGHVGATEPAWLKPAQILPIGLMLGWLYRRCGAESCIVAHALFNVILAPLAPYLVGT